jgi:uncharacterized membrane protein YkvA (DUF1232 family)
MLGAGSAIHDPYKILSTINLPSTAWSIICSHETVDKAATVTLANGSRAVYNIMADRKGTTVAENKRLDDPERTAGLLAEIARQSRLIWRLLGDRRVPVWPKLIIPATFVYIVSPIDLIADPILGLGQIDDIAVLLIGLKLFVELCPTDVVREHLDNLASVIDGSYRVVKEEQDEQAPAQGELAAPEGELSAPRTEPRAEKLPAVDGE